MGTTAASITRSAALRARAKAQVHRLRYCNRSHAELQVCDVSVVVNFLKRACGEQRDGKGLSRVRKRWGQGQSARSIYAQRGPQV